MPAVFSVTVKVCVPASVPVNVYGDGRIAWPSFEPKVIWPVYAGVTFPKLSLAVTLVVKDEPAVWLDPAETVRWSVAAGTTETARRSVPVVASEPAVAAICTVSALSSTIEPPAVETPFVNVRVVAVPKVRTTPSLSVTVGSLAPIEEAPGERQGVVAGVAGRDVAVRVVRRDRQSVRVAGGLDACAHDREARSRAGDDGERGARPGEEHVTRGARCCQRDARLRLGVGSAADRRGRAARRDRPGQRSAEDAGAGAKAERDAGRGDDRARVAIRILRLDVDRERRAGGRADAAVDRGDDEPVGDRGDGERRARRGAERVAGRRGCCEADARLGLRVRDGVQRQRRRRRASPRWCRRACPSRSRGSASPSSPGSGAEGLP